MLSMMVVSKVMAPMHEDGVSAPTALRREATIPCPTNLIPGGTTNLHRVEFKLTQSPCKAGPFVSSVQDQ